MKAAVFPAALLMLLGAGDLSAADSADQLIAQADALDKKNDNKAALPLLIEADRQRPNNAEILRRIAKQQIDLFVITTNAAQKKRLGDLAQWYGQQAVQADPNNAKAHLSLSVIYGRIAFLEPARRKVELSRLIESEAALAAKLDPREEYAWHVLGRWNYELANFNGVLKGLAELIYGRFPPASLEKAAEYFQKAIALDPQSVIHHVELGRTYLALGKTAEGKAEIEKGLALPSVTKDDEETKQRGRLALKGLP